MSKVKRSISVEKEIEIECPRKIVLAKGTRSPERGYLTAQWHCLLLSEVCCRLNASRIFIWTWPSWAIVEGKK